MEDGDDFGDLYGGLYDQVYTGISSTDVSNAFAGEDAPNNTAPASDPPHVAKEPLSDRLHDGREGVSVAVEEEMEEAEEDGDNGSDSEDDIHIVLNDEDCARFGAGEADRETGDGGDCGEKGRWIGSGKLQSVGDGADQGERGLYGMNGGGPHHSQLKGFGNFSSPRAGKRERDVSSMSEVADHYFASTAPRNLRGPAVVRNGFDFFLPRSRTIFDVNIEAFEWKPWRSHGADVTDYFNFGMNEDTWKSYCGSVDDFRKQNMLPNAFGSSKAFEYEQSHGAASSDSLVQVGGAISAIERPIGKAIQVEGGVGERMPSMETKRFRNRDSDVVIQIKMEDTVEDTSGLANVGLTSDGLDVESKENLVGSLSVDVKTEMLPSEQAQEISMEMVNNVDQQCLHFTKKSDSTSEKSRGQPGSDKEENCSMPSTENAISKSLIGVDVGCDLNPSFLDSEESLNDVSSDEDRSPGKSSSLDSVSGSPDSVISDKCVYNDSRSSNKRPSQVTGTCSTSYKYDGTRHKIKERLPVNSHVYSVEDNEEATHHAQRKGKKELNHFKTCSDKQQRSCKRSSFSGNEVEGFVSHRIKSSSKDKVCSHRNCLVKGDSGHCCREKCNRSHSSCARSSRYNHGSHLKRCSLEKEHDDVERRHAISGLHNKNKKLAAVKVPAYLREDCHLYQRRKRVRDRDIRMEVQQDYAIEYNHTEDAIHEWHDEAIMYYEQDHGIQNKFHIDEHRIHPLREQRLNHLSRVDSEVDIDYRRWNGHRSHECRVRSVSIERDVFDVLPDSSLVHSSRKPSDRQRGRWKASAFFDIASEKPTERAEDGSFYDEQELRYDSLYRHRWLPDEAATIMCCERDDFYFPDLPFRGSPEHEENGSMHLSTSGRHSDNIYQENSRTKNMYEESAYYEARKLNNTYWGEELVGRPIDRQERKPRRGSKAGRASGKRKVTKLTEERHLDVAVGNNGKEPGPHYPVELIDQHDRPQDPVIHCNPHLKESCVEIPARQDPDGSELEEGQLVEEPEDKDVSSVLNTHSPVNQVLPNIRRNKKGRTQNHTGKNPDNVETIENNRLLEALEKMQKRSERFKEPFSDKKDQHPDPERPQLLLQSEPTIVTDEMKQRPARKRRWGGS